MESIDSKILFKKRVFHLDLKGAPFRVEFYSKLFPFLKNIGIDCILIEYEDMFPFEEILSKVACPNSYSHQNIKLILSLAENNKLEVIPLIQVFGHLEFVLKHDSFKDLREVQDYPSVLCPSKKGSWDLITNLLDQIISAHPESKYIHIGADEVWYLGCCEVCVAKLVADGLSQEELYIEYICSIARHIKKKYNDLNVIIWDDMIRNTTSEILSNQSLHTLVEPMVWHYMRSDKFDVIEGAIIKYCGLFPKIWIASAFKGATGPTSLLTSADYHMENHIHWLKLMKKLANKISVIQGIVLTGWQRYDHFARLCELLPVGIPSLVLCLQTLENKNELDAHAKASNILGLENQLVDMNPYMSPQPQTGFTFPGSEVYEWVCRLSIVLKHCSHTLDSDIVAGWVTPWHFTFNRISSRHMQAAIPILLSGVQTLEDAWGALKMEMVKIYYEDTVEEFYLESVQDIHMRLSERVNNINFHLNFK